MPAQNPVLAGVTLPCPTKYKSSWRVDGGAEQAANGAVKLSTINARNRGRFVMEFELVTAVEESDFTDAWDALRNTSVAFTDPMGRNYTVTREPTVEELMFDWQPYNSGWVASVSISLMEVLETD